MNAMEWKRFESDSVEVEVEVEALPSENGSDTVNWRSAMLLPNRSALRESPVSGTSGSSVASEIKVDNDFAREGYQSGAVSSQTEPGRFQGTRLLTHQEVRRRTYDALKEAERRRNELREREDRYECGSSK